MNIKKNLIFLFILIFLIFIPLFFYFSSISFEQIHYVTKYNLVIQNYINENFIFFIFYYSLFVFLSVLINLPGGSIRAIFAGYFLGVIIGISVIIIVTTFSSFLLFLFYKKKIYDKYNFEFPKYKNIFSKIKNEFLLLCLIRLIPIVPFFIQNIIIAKFSINKFKYLITTIIGIFPTNILYVLIGSQIDDIIELQNIDISSIILENKILIYTVLSLIIYLITINTISFIDNNKKS